MTTPQDGSATTSLILAAQTSMIACGWYDSTGGQNIYLGDSVYTAYFAIHNKSTDTTYGLVAPASIGSQPSTSAHFYLTFSVNVLLSADSYPMSGDPNWVVTPRTATGTSGQTVVSGLYLTYMGSEPYQLHPEGNLLVPILYKSVSSYTDESECNITISLLNLGTLWSPAPPPQAAIQMTESLGSFLFELLPEVVGVGTVYNDGQTASSVTLRLTNPTTTAILLDAGSLIFKLSVDTAPSNTDTAAPTALCTPHNASQITVGVPSGFDIPAAPTNQNDTRTLWDIKTSSGASHISIPAGGKLDFTLGNIKTDFPPGRTTLYIQCINVPSMQGQVLVCMTEKTALYSPQWASGTASHPVGTTLNSATLLYAPTSLTNGGAGLKLSGAMLADKSASIGLIRIDGTGGYHGILMENIGDSTYGLKITAASAAAALYVSQTGSGAAMTIVGGAEISANNGSPTLHLTQNSTGNTLRLTGGSGAVIESMGSASNSLNITANSTVSALQLTQNGGGNGLTITQNAGAFAATLENRGLSIHNVTGANNGLLMSANTTLNAIDVTQAGTGSALKLTQSSTGKTLEATGGAGVAINGISGSNVALTLSSNSTGAALSVNQSGTGAGINIIQNNGSSLTIQQGSSSAGLSINQTGSGAGLSLTKTGSGTALSVTAASGQQAAKFVGDVEIDGNLTVKGSIIVDTHNNSAQYIVLQSAPSGEPTLVLLTPGSGPADISLWSITMGAYVDSSHKGNIQFASSDGNQKGYIYFNPTYGMSVSQSVQDSGKIKLDTGKK